MMPTAVAASSRPASATSYDRRFYSGLAILMAVIVLIGFGPTFYLRSYFGAPVTVTGLVTMTPLVAAHGIAFTAWVLLFIVQTQLIASRNVAMHRRFGFAGAGLAAVMIVVGLMAAFAGAKRGSVLPGLDAATSLVVPVADIVLFTGFVTAAVLRRRDKDAHKRLMLMAYASIFPAPVGRLPGVIALGPPGVFGLAFLPVILGAVYDRWSRGRVTPIYWWGLGILFLSIPGRLLIASTAPWKAFAAWVIG